MKIGSISAMMLALFLGVILVASATAKPMNPHHAYKSELYMELNWDWVGFGGSSPYTWIGYVWGEELSGDFYVTLTEASFPGKTEHFSETWILETIDGVLEGFDVGVWRMSNFKWVANGAVTSADGEVSYLDGSKMQYSGTTTEFPVPPGTPVTATGRLMIVPS